MAMYEFSRISILKLMEFYSKVGLIELIFSLFYILLSEKIKCLPPKNSIIKNCTIKTMVSVGKGV